MMSTLVVACIAFAAGAIFRRRRKISVLPQARALPAGRAPVRSSGTATLPAAPLYELAGLLTVYPKELKGRGVVAFVLREGQEYEVEVSEYLHQDLLGTLIVELRHWSEECAYCRSGETARIDIVDNVPVPVDVPDFGYVRRWVIGVYCASCGLQRAAKPYLSPYDAVCKKAIEPFASTPNLHAALKKLAEQNGRLSKEMRFQMLDDEIERLKSRLFPMLDERRELREELNPPAKTMSAAPLADVPSAGTTIL